jgi:hypothetical protein
MHVQILRQPPGNAAPIPVAKKAIKMDELPWNSKGQESNQCTTQFTCFNGTNVKILTLRCAAGAGAAASEPRGLDGRSSFWGLFPRSRRESQAGDLLGFQV